jgi:oligosaccharide repeat unit polymerase
MIFEIWSLIALNVAIVTIFVLKKCFFLRKLEVNHILLFSLGFIVYWILPIAVGSMRLFEETPGMVQWYELYDRVPDSAFVTYLLCCLASYIAFCAGDVSWPVIVGKRLSKYKVTFLDRFDKRLLNLYLVFGILVAFAFASQLRGEFFKGYLGNISEDFGWRGSFTASSLMLLALALIYSFKLYARQGPSLRLRDFAGNRFFIAYLLVAALVLSLGGRLYFISSILMLLVVKTVYFKRIAVGSLFIVVLVVVGAMGIVGLLRAGIEIGMYDVAFNLLFEFLSTGTPLIYFLGEQKLEVIAFPIFLFYDFTSLVPTFLMPDKTQLLLRPEEYGYTLYNPLGALNSFVSFNINFGVVGTTLFLYFLAAFLGYLRASGKVVLFKVMYVMLSGWLAFTFFRDPFSTSLVKSMLEFSVVIPALIILSLHLITISVQKKSLPNAKP